MTRLTELAKQNYLRMLRGEKPVMSGKVFLPAKGPKVPRRSS
ncbi:hypothetical protein pEaSNUABM5_00114 [Erwinia phage pEa_SNUABM_5]|uniref:Uncharacterized protein n=1 Tax=Erwinia phage pEa_SNUABM_5 TaxID=2797313 RepID=A0A7T8IVN7_9CAUD|nr:hypothetical protein MPK73_gp114 [Erwinia phage pEa_SNUABM_5]QQO90256.1 hypothetical protein pEaSNUABM5_00114 [Erwinia phage pEa_SNUABM_5]